MSNARASATELLIVYTLVVGACIGVWVGIAILAQRIGEQIP